MDSTIMTENRNQSDHAYWDKMVSPGADDNASSFVMLLQVLEAVSQLFATKRVQNEVQFHFWGAEEIGLKGSNSVFAALRNESRSVKAVLNFDMVGWAQGHKPGHPKIAVHADHIHSNLTEFTKKVIGYYLNEETGETHCGYPCSDHASAWFHGFPSAALGESSFLKLEDINPNIHTVNDTVDTLDVEYMLLFAKVATAWVTELAYTNFTDLNHQAGIN